MKKRFKKIVIISMSALLSVFILGYISFLAPYNLKDLYNTSEFKSNPEILKYLSDYEIKKVKYLGNNTYEIFTDKDNFIAITDYSDSVTWKYKIYRYDRELEYFSNPM